MNRVLLVLVMLATASCTQNGARQSPSPTPTPPGVTIGAQPPPGSVVMDVSRGLFLWEGSVFFIEISTDQGDRVFEESHKAADRAFVVRRSLPPGKYHVLTYERPCGGTCKALGPPTSRCAWDLIVESGEKYVLPVHTGLDVLRCPTD